VVAVAVLLMTIIVPIGILHTSVVLVLVAINFILILKNTSFSPKYISIIRIAQHLMWRFDAQYLLEIIF
jgi:hypothetical protein